MQYRPNFGAPIPMVATTQVDARAPKHVVVAFGSVNMTGGEAPKSRVRIIRALTGRKGMAE